MLIVRYIGNEKSHFVAKTFNSTHIFHTNVDSRSLLPCRWQTIRRPEQMHLLRDLHSDQPPGGRASCGHGRPVEKVRCLPGLQPAGYPPTQRRVDPPQALRIESTEEELGRQPLGPEEHVAKAVQATVLR